MRTRNEVLEDLIGFKRDLGMLTSELSQFPWDCEQPLAVLSATDLLRIIERYERIEFGAEVLEDWANAIELRDDVGFETERVKTIVHEMANPELFGYPAHAELKDFRERLQ